MECSSNVGHDADENFRRWRPEMEAATVASVRRPRKDKIVLIREAIALEDAGCNWTQAHVAALCNRSVSYIRNSDCPKSHEDGHGPKGKRLLVYQPAMVRAWMSARVRAIVDTTERR
jgi:hypothetical protein